MWTRKSWVACVGLTALASLAVLGGCRSGGHEGGCCGGRSPGTERVSAATAPGSPKPPDGAADGKPAVGLYGGQRTCPVTGEALGGMGPPVPVTLNGQTVYVCCKACVAKAQRDPDASLRKVQADRAGPPGG